MEGSKAEAIACGCACAIENSCDSGAELVVSWGGMVGRVAAMFVSESQLMSVDVWFATVLLGQHWSLVYRDG
jgi:hypothetical protein